MDIMDYSPRFKKLPDKYLRPPPRLILQNPRFPGRKSLLSAGGVLQRNRIGEARFYRKISSEMILTAPSRIPAAVGPPKKRLLSHIKRSINTATCKGIL